jgi:hypothetical protein
MEFDSEVVFEPFFIPKERFLSMIKRAFLLFSLKFIDQEFI